MRRASKNDYKNEERILTTILFVPEKDENAQEILVEIRTYTNISILGATVSVVEPSNWPAGKKVSEILNGNQNGKVSADDNEHMKIIWQNEADARDGHAWLVDNVNPKIFRPRSL